MYNKALENCQNIQIDETMLATAQLFVTGDFVSLNKFEIYQRSFFD
jgi:hypothetical protein